MKLAHGTFAFTLLFGGALALTGCSEKGSSGGGKTTPSSTPSGGDNGTDTSDDDDGDDDDSGGEGDGTAGFNLCDAVKKAGSDFSKLTSDFCDNLDDLKKSENRYTGSDAKIGKANVNKGTSETSLRLRSSMLVDAKASDYYALIQLQLKDSEKYKEHYERDDQVTLSQQKVSGDKVSFHYTYVESNGPGSAEYEATTKFIVLKEGQAYMSATKLDKSIDTLKALTGIIVVSKSGTKTAVYSISDQTYTHGDNSGDSAEKSAISSAEGEQARMYKNAKKADQAPDLLK